MRNLNYQLKQLCYANRDGSFSTQANRQRILNLVANQLHDMGYRKMGVRSLKPKHVDALVNQWIVQGLATGTIKNRMNSLRWWVAKVDRRNVIARSNDQYGIPRRQFISKESKAVILGAGGLASIKNEYVRMSLELQQAFGLRREEAIKFVPSYADKGSFLELKASWTKGGRSRVIPILEEFQRRVLDKAHKLVGKLSLIQPNKTYVQQLRLYERHTARAGLSRLHGLRHAYAQQRYKVLTGWLSPAAGGPHVNYFNSKQTQDDNAARLTISKELGHSRAQISTVYLGR